MNEHAVMAVSAIFLVGLGCRWIAWRVKLPAILFLLIGGILAGPVMHWLHPDRMFGHLLFPFISLAVAVILFEGSLTLKFQDIPGLEKVIRNMITFGVVITWPITALATRWLLHFSWGISFLCGALFGGDRPHGDRTDASDRATKAECGPHPAMGRHSDRSHRRHAGHSGL